MLVNNSSMDLSRGSRRTAFLSPVQQNALSNHLIVTEIFKNLGFQDLKISRQVCQLWREIGTRQLLFRKSCQIILWETAEDATCRVGSQSSATTVSNLLLRVESKAFPHCNSFHIYARDLSKLIPFFDSYGCFIQSLSITECTRLRSIVNLATVLKRCPNIESLQIDLRYTMFATPGGVEEFLNLFPGHSENISSNCQSHVFLPNLLYLELILSEDIPRFGEDISLQYRNTVGQILTALIRASPNLTELQNFNSLLTDTVIELNKLSLVKCFDFRPGSPDTDLQLASNLAMHTPALDQMKFQCQRYHVPKEIHLTQEEIETIRRLLESSHSSLVNLRTDALGVLGNCAIEDPFEKLEDLTIHSQNFSSSLLPCGIGFSSRMFPSLKCVRFEIPLRSASANALFSYSSDLNEGCFSDVLPNVKTIQASQGIDTHGFGLLAAKFPNITKMTLKDTHFAVTSTGCSIWALLPSALQTLEISDSTFDFDTEEKNFDCIFTGLPLATCKELRPNPTSAACENWERNKSWIGTLENLKRLKFSFHQKQSYWDPYWGGDSWILSTVSAVHGFRKVTGLLVIIGYDRQHPKSTVLQRKLEPLEPFVIFQHESLE